MDFGSLVHKGEIKLTESVELHERAIVACTCGIIGRSRYKCLFRATATHLMKDSALGSHNELGGVSLASPVKKHSCRPHLVGDDSHMSRTLGMNEYLGSGMLSLEFKNLFKGELLVHMACTIPQHHVTTGLRIDIISQIAVGTKNYFLILRQRIDHLHGIAGSDDNIGESLDGSRSVDVRDHSVTRMILYEFFKFGSRATVGKRASGIEVRHQHLLLRTKNLDSLAHEMHSAHHDYGIVETFCDPGKSEGVAYKISHLLDFTHRVVMGEDDSVLLFFESENLFFQVNAFRHRSLDVAVIDFHLFMFEKFF